MTNRNAQTEFTQILKSIFEGQGSVPSFFQLHHNLLIKKFESVHAQFCDIYNRSTEDEKNAVHFIEMQNMIEKIKTDFISLLDNQEGNCRQTLTTSLNQLTVLVQIAKIQLAAKNFKQDNFEIENNNLESLCSVAREAAGFPEHPGSESPVLSKPKANLSIVSKGLSSIEAAIKAPTRSNLKKLEKFNFTQLNSKNHFLGKMAGIGQVILGSLIAGIGTAIGASVGIVFGCPPAGAAIAAASLYVGYRIMRHGTKRYRQSNNESKIPTISEGKQSEESSCLAEFRLAAQGLFSTKTSDMHIGKKDDIDSTSANDVPESDMLTFFN